MRAFGNSTVASLSFALCENGKRPGEPKRLSLFFGRA
jgi:hypothetical protein